MTTLLHYRRKELSSTLTITIDTITYRNKMTATNGGAKARNANSPTKEGKQVTAKKAGISPIIKKNKKKGSKAKAWNTMSHLFLKRFADNDATLTPGAKRDRKKHPHVAIAELDPSGRSSCKLCGDTISKSSLRFGMMLECHKGYRILCTLHPDCFWKHPEISKLDTVQEIHMSPKLTKEQSASIVAIFDKQKKGAVK